MCPDCGCPDVVVEMCDTSGDERGRCHNCGYRGDVEEFAGEESMDEEVQITPTEEARVLMCSIQQHEIQKAQLIINLQERRQQIDQALIDLGARRKRRKSDGKRRGRPPGSRNKVAPIGGEAA